MVTVLELKEIHELIKSKNANDELLTFDESNGCLELLYSQELNLCMEGYQSLWYDYIMNCDNEYIVRQMTQSDRFLSVFAEVFHSMPSLKYVTALETLFEKYFSVTYDECSIVNLLDYLQKNTDVMGTLMNSVVGNFSDTTLIKISLQCVLYYFELLEKLIHINPALASSYVVLAILFLFQHDFFTILTIASTQNMISEEKTMRFYILRTKFGSHLHEARLDQYNIPLLLEKLKETLESSNLRNVFDDAEIEANANRTLDDYKQLPLSLLQAYDMISFLSYPDQAFNKAIYRDLIFQKHPFPIYKFMVNISRQFQTFLDSIKDNTNSLKIQITINREAVLYRLMQCSLRFWTESHSATENDVNSILDIIPIVLHALQLNLDNKAEKKNQWPTQFVMIELVLEFLDEITYSDACRSQVSDIKAKHLSKWSEHATEFNELLGKQVHDYVTHQRLQLLQKGTWVYAQNPLTTSEPKLYFIVVSDNNLQLLARQFDRTLNVPLLVLENQIFTQEESTDSSSASSGNRHAKRNTKVVSLKQMESLETRELQQENGSNKFLHLGPIPRHIVYTEIKMLDAQGKTLLMFYLDTKEATYIWSDGLQLISIAEGREVSPQLTNETLEQMNTLTDVRQNVQMITLDSQADKYLADLKLTEEEEQHFYDIDNLKQLVDEFYYE